MSKKFLYLFKEGHDAFGGDQTTMKNTLGGKGAGLAEMTHAGMPAWVISARPAPLPPRVFFMVVWSPPKASWPSLNRYKNFLLIVTSQFG